jgi:hypothetical protein
MRGKKASSGVPTRFVVRKKIPWSKLALDHINPQKQSNTRYNIPGASRKLIIYQLYYFCATNIQEAIILSKVRTVTCMNVNVVRPTCHFDDPNSFPPIFEFCICLHVRPTISGFTDFCVEKGPLLVYQTLTHPAYSPAFLVQGCISLPMAGGL